MDGSILPMPAARSAAMSAPAWADRAAELLRQDFWTAADLEALGLVELPQSARRIHTWMQRQQVLFEAQAGNGGTTYRYNLYSMPATLRRAIAAAVVPWVMPAGPAAPAAERDIADRVADIRSLEGLPGKLVLRAQARLAAVRGFEAWAAAAGLGGARGAERFAAAWSAGGIAAPDWVRAALPACCGKSLLTWQRQYRAEGLKALAGAYKPRVALLDQKRDWGDLALALVATEPTIAAARVHEHLAQYAWGEDAAPPSLRAVERWMANWREQNRLTWAVLRNPDAARGHLMPAVGDAGASADGLNAVWEMDTTPADVMTADGRRWTIIVIIDVWSRDVVVRLAETTSGHSARLTFRQALLQLGVPKLLRTDNGSDLRNQTTEHLLQALGIDLPLMEVGRPDRKPFVERVIKTLNYDLVPLLPGYTGHSVADAQAIRSRRSFIAQRFQKGAVVETRLSAAELQAFLDTWVKGYRGRVHSALKATPAARRAAWTGPVRRIEDERGLDLLLAPLAGGDGLRTVTKKGIQAGGHYAAAELGDLVGERVLCRHDPADAGRLYVFLPDGRFLCVAEDWRLTGTDPEELARAVKARWREEVKAGSADMREKRRRINRDTLAQDMANARAARAATVVALPRPALVHSTPALEQAGLAARAEEHRPAPERTALDAQRAQRVAEAAAARASQTSEEARREARIARGWAVWTALQAERGAPTALPENAVALRPSAASEADREWFAGYRDTGEWRQAMRERGLDPRTGKPLFADQAG